MTILLRRFTILCLTFVVFALVMVMTINNTARRTGLVPFGLDAPCPQPSGIHCRARN
jgi:hypothetical protein